MCAAATLMGRLGGFCMIAEEPGRTKMGDAWQSQAPRHGQLDMRCLQVALTFRPPNPCGVQLPQAQLEQQAALASSATDNSS